MDQLAELQALEQELQDAVTEKAELEGQKTQLLKALKERFGVNSLEEAVALVETKNAKLIEYETSIQQLSDKIENAMAKNKGVE
jgi:hypothetical protein